MQPPSSADHTSCAEVQAAQHPPSSSRPSTAASSTPRPPVGTLLPVNAGTGAEAGSRDSLTFPSALANPPFGRVRSAAATVVSIPVSGSGVGTGTVGDGDHCPADRAPAIPTLPLSPLYASPATLADSNNNVGDTSRPTTASALMEQDPNAAGPRTRYTTAATSASDCTAVGGHHHLPNHGDWSLTSYSHSLSTPHVPSDTLQTGSHRSPDDLDAHPQSTTASHSPSSASITLFDNADTIRPGHRSAHRPSVVAGYQPLTQPKDPTVANHTDSSPVAPPIQKHANTDTIPSVYSRVCPNLATQRLIPRTRTRRIVCFTCIVLALIVLSIGIYIAVTLSSLVPPKLDLLRTSPPSPPRQPVAINMNGPVVTIQWDLVVSIENANSIPIELYDIRFAGHASPPNAAGTGAASQPPPLASGNLTTMALPARANSTSPSRSEWLVPVTIPWHVRDSTQNAFLVNLLTACNAPKPLVPNGATVKPGDKVRLWYSVDAGVERLRWFAGGYRHKHEAWAEFACPVNLSDVPGMKEVAGIVGTVGEVLGGLMQSGSIPDIRLPSIPSLFGL